jgi:hypothetical protein
MKFSFFCWLLDVLFEIYALSAFCSQSDIKKKKIPEAFYGYFLQAKKIDKKERNLCVHEKIQKISK